MYYAAVRHRARTRDNLRLRAVRLSESSLIIRSGYWFIRLISHHPARLVSCLRGSVDYASVVLLQSLSQNK